MEEGTEFKQKEAYSFRCCIEAKEEFLKGEGESLVF
jgi:hypothetical protein